MKYFGIGIQSGGWVILAGRPPVGPGLVFHYSVSCTRTKACGAGRGADGEANIGIEGFLRGTGHSSEPVYEFLVPRRSPLEVHGSRSEEKYTFLPISTVEIAPYTL